MTAATTDDDVAHDGGGTKRSAAKLRKHAARPRRGEQNPDSETAPSDNPTADPDARIGEGPTELPPPLSPEEIAGIEARASVRQEYWDRVHDRLRMDAQSCARSMRNSPLFGRPAEWDDIVARSLDDYRSGRSLMDHIGTDRLIDPALTGMLLAIRRGLIEEAGAVSMSDYVLVDMAVIAFANAMRVQSIIGNTAIVLESEMFCQPSLRAKWAKEYGYRPEDIRGLAVEEHVTRLREALLPLAERFSRMAQEAVDGLRRQRREPSVEVERSVPFLVRLAPIERPVIASESRQLLEVGVVLDKDPVAEARTVSR